MLSPLLQNFFNELRDEFGFGDIPIQVNSRSRVDDTPLHIAAIRGVENVVRELLENGAEIDALGESGYSPLHYAVEQGHPHVVSLLLCHGADTTIRFFNGEGQTAKELAEQENNQVMIRLLE